MPLGIGPVPLPRFVNSLECHSWIDPNEFGLKTETSLSPAMVDVPAVIEDRIVQIEKNSLWWLTVHNIFIGVGAQANLATIPEVSRVLLRKS